MRKRILKVNIALILSEKEEILYKQEQDATKKGTFMDMGTLGY